MRMFSRRDRRAYRQPPINGSVGAGLFALAAVTVLLATPPPTQAADPFLRRTATVNVVEQVGPSVVNITSERITKTPSPFGRNMRVDPNVDSYFRHLFEPRSRTEQSLGSGVIFDRQGHVLTNEHVVARADRVRVMMADGRVFDTQLVGERLLLEVGQ